MIAEVLTMEAYVIGLYLFWQAVSFLPKWGKRFFTRQ